MEEIDIDTSEAKELDSEVIEGAAAISISELDLVAEHVRKAVGKMWIQYRKPDKEHQGTEPAFLPLPIPPSSLWLALRDRGLEVSWAQVDEAMARTWGCSLGVSQESLEVRSHADRLASHIVSLTPSEARV